MLKRALSVAAPLLLVAVTIGLVACGPTQSANDGRVTLGNVEAGIEQAKGDSDKVNTALTTSVILGYEQTWRGELDTQLDTAAADKAAAERALQNAEGRLDRYGRVADLTGAR